ncbi:MAG: hypothetical protein HZA54_12125, partial [Planctomycetes bacterium]|nr:hypothetical protein [Planctomycetota bacterium]
RPTAIRRQHTLALDLAPLPASVRADASKFRQIFHNLLSNAVKFTPPGGTITVAAGALALPSARYPELVLRAGVEGFVEFSVADTGIGISPEAQTKIFEPFHQLDSALSRQFEGTGLGLALTRRLVEMLGGRMHLESAPGKGSTFFVVLPYAATTAD